MDGAGGLTLSLASCLKDVRREAWDAVANPPSRPFDPFMSWDFLEALEASGCATGRTGWAPMHLLAHAPSGALVGENIGWGAGSRATPSAVVRAWMRSRPHRAALLSRRFRSIGTGVAIGSPRSGMSGAATYTANFGRRR